MPSLTPPLSRPFLKNHGRGVRGGILHPNRCLKNKDIGGVYKHPFMSHALRTRSKTERRILATKWLGEAWEEYTTNHQDEITLAFKKCGMYNALDGSENYLIKVKGAKDYKPPKKDDPKQ